jgi:hypothetical protein
MTLNEMVMKTGKRMPSFSWMLQHLNKTTNPLIIETGCARQEDNYDGDGMSTLIFDAYVKEHGGEFHSIDINPLNTDFAKSKTSVAKVHTSDSVKFLYEFNQQNKKIDLLYLDSFDLDASNPHPSSLHHIFELTAIMPSLKEDTMICVDDNLDIGVGKGGYVNEFMNLLGKPKLYSGYQWIWIL